MRPTLAYHAAAAAAKTRPKSGLQKEVMDLYRRGLRNVKTKPEDARPAFLLHLRHIFRYPPLSPRAYSAIEHRLRLVGRQIESLEAPEVKRMGVGAGWEEWWQQEVARARRGHIP